MKVLEKCKLANVYGGDHWGYEQEDGSYSSGMAASYPGGSFGNSYSPPTTSSSTSNCATAECAAGLLPATIDNRSASQIDKSLCNTVVSIAALPVSLANLALGLGLAGTVTKGVTKQGLQSALCN